MAHIVQLIYASDRRGDGSKEDPMRIVPQLWTLDGVLVASQDDADGIHDAKVVNLHLGQLLQSSQGVR